MTSPWGSPIDKARRGEERPLSSTTASNQLHCPVKSFPSFCPQEPSHKPQTPQHLNHNVCPQRRPPVARARAPDRRPAAGRAGRPQPGYRPAGGFEAGFRAGQVGPFVQPHPRA